MNGKFERVDNPNPEIGDILMLPYPSKKWFYRLVFYSLILLLMSPWIFITVKNHSIGSWSQKVTDFYDDTFSCKSLNIQKNEKDNASMKSTSYSI